MKSQIVNVSLNQVYVGKLNLLCERYGVSRSELVRRAIDALHMQSTEEVMRMKKFDLKSNPAPKTYKLTAAERAAERAKSLLTMPEEEALNEFAIMGLLPSDGPDSEGVILSKKVEIRNGERCAVIYGTAEKYKDISPDSRIEIAVTSLPSLIEQAREQKLL